ncbi:MAG TPA: pyridoxal-phosphate dependent enzyme, partial [Polyangiaceae bacterium]|nr:pyridoxal-phosphate dependent enzyme [Polyangiaceae bacterium]
MTRRPSLSRALLPREGPHVIPLGHYPTPVQRVERLSAPGSELWIKRDDRTGDVYGGNKVRKLEWLLADARDRGAKRVVTVGAAGSHH